MDTLQHTRKELKKEGKSLRKSSRRNMSDRLINCEVHLKRLEPTNSWDSMSSKSESGSPNKRLKLRTSKLRQEREKTIMKRKMSLRKQSLLQSTASTSKATKVETCGKLKRKKIEKSSSSSDSDFEPVVKKEAPPKKPVPKKHTKKIEDSSSSDSAFEPVVVKQVIPKNPVPKRHTKKKLIKAKLPSNDALEPYPVSKQKPTTLIKPKSPPSPIANFDSDNEAVIFDPADFDSDAEMPQPVEELKMETPSSTTKESMPDLDAPEIKDPLEIPENQQLAPVQRLRIEFMPDDKAAGQVTKQRKRNPPKQKVDSFCQTEGGNINEPLPRSPPRLRPQDMVEITTVKVHKNALTPQLMQTLHNGKGSDEPSSGLGVVRGPTIEPIPKNQCKPSPVPTTSQTPRTQVEEIPTLTVETSTQAGTEIIFNDDFEKLLNEISNNDLNTPPQPINEDDQFGSSVSKNPIPEESIVQQQQPTFQMSFEGEKDFFAIDEDDRKEAENRKDDFELEWFGLQLDEKEMVDGGSDEKKAGQMQTEAKTDSKCESSEPNKAHQKAEKRPMPDLVQINPKKKVQKDRPMFARTSILEQNTPQPSTSRFERPGQSQQVAGDSTTTNVLVSSPPKSPPRPTDQILPFTNICPSHLATGDCNSSTCGFEHKDYEPEELLSHLLTLEPLLMWDIIKHISNYRLAFLTYFPLFCGALGERGMRAELVALFPLIERPSMPNYDVNYRHIFRGLIRAGLSPVDAASAILQHHKKRTHKALDAVILILLETGPEAIVFMDQLDSFASMADYEFPCEAISTMFELQATLNDMNWFQLLMKIIAQLPEEKRNLLPPEFNDLLAEAAAQMSGQDLPDFAYGDEGGDAIDDFGYDEEAEAEENAAEWWTDPY